MATIINRRIPGDLSRTFSFVQSAKWKALHLSFQTCILRFLNFYKYRGYPAMIQKDKVRTIKSRVS